MSKRIIAFNLIAILFLSGCGGGSSNSSSNNKVEGCLMTVFRDVPNVGRIPSGTKNICAFAINVSNIDGTRRASLAPNQTGSLIFGISAVCRSPFSPTNVRFENGLKFKCT